MHKPSRNLHAGMRRFVLLVCFMGVHGQDLFLANTPPDDTPPEGPSVDALMTDLFQFWESFREPESGFYCDHVFFEGNRTCGPSDVYSSAGTGMGLIAECVFAEVGLLTREDAEGRVKKTMANLARWPGESFHGFLAHFVKASGGGYVGVSEYSTIDTAELVMGAFFAGNYFGGEVLAQARALAQNVTWSDAILDAEQPTIFPMVDPGTGAMSGNIRPFNEYYIVAYAAQLMDPNPDSKASRYFETYMGTSGAPVGRDGFPFHLSYAGQETLTDNPGGHFMSSFIPQFCWFQTRGFHTNTYYSESLFPSWLRADMAYWETLLDQDTVVWGHKVQGRLFGSGAGPGCDNGYTVNRINGTEEPIFSAAIMAGFLGAADDKVKSHINEQLTWLYDNNVCTYEKPLPNGARPRVPWRCSVRNPEWRCPSADSIDFSAMVLGYALNFLPSKFYPTYAA